jgi:predicted GIY-YIG superfamily endonuclease
MGARYTQLHKPRELIYTEEFYTICEAMTREKQIKRLSHKEKAALANHFG